MGTGSQGGELVAQADAKGGDAGGEHFADVGDDLHILGRVAGAVGEHQAVRVQLGQLGGGGGARQHGHAAAALLQAAHDIIFAAQVQQGHMQRGITPLPCLGGFVSLGLPASNGLNRVDHRVGGDLRQQGGFLLRFGIGVELGGDSTVHNAAFPQGAGQAAGIDALNADDAVFF